MSWATIRDGVATRLATISGLSVSDVFRDESPNGTSAMVLPAEPVISPAGHNGYVAVNFLVRVQCVRATLKDSQAVLDDYIWPTGTKSIAAAIRGDSTLGGVVDDVKFIDVRNYGRVETTQGAGADIAFEARVVA